MRVMSRARLLIVVAVLAAAVGLALMFIASSWDF